VGPRVESGGRRVDGGALGHQRHRVEPLAEWSQERGGHALAQDRHDGRTTDQNDPRQRLGLEAVVHQEAQADVDRAVHQWHAEPIESGAGDLHVHIDRCSVNVERGRDREGRGRRPGQLDLRFLGRVPELAQPGAVLGVRTVDGDALGARDLGQHPVDERRVEVPPAQEVVAVVSDDAEEAVAGLQQ